MQSGMVSIGALHVQLLGPKTASSDIHVPVVKSWQMREPRVKVRKQGVSYRHLVSGGGEVVAGGRWHWQVGGMF